MYIEITAPILIDLIFIKLKKKEPQFIIKLKEAFVLPSYFVIIKEFQFLL